MLDSSDPGKTHPRVLGGKTCTADSALPLRGMKTMMNQLQSIDSRWGFFWPFFEYRTGRIFALVNARDDIRDGLAAAQISRYFPLPEFEGIVLEPSRPDIQPAENIILIGDTSLYLDPKARRASGEDPTLRVREARLARRLRKLDEECCYRFAADGKDRVVLNRVTGERHQPRMNSARDLEEDYGVIRRLFCGPNENTIALEGVNRLGTLGATKVATSRNTLNEIWNAIGGSDSNIQSCPLEVLVRARFHPRRSEGVYAFENITAEPLAIVVKKQWICDLVDGRRWTDQLPWDYQLSMKNDDPARVLEGKEKDFPVPRLEIRADLGGGDSGIAEVCRKVLPGPNGKPEAKRGPSAETVTRFLEKLTAQAEQFSIALVTRAPWNVGVSVTELPKGKLTRPRLLRKQLLIHMILGHLVGRGFRCDDETVRRYFPKFQPGSSSKPLAKVFIASVKGKLPEGFESLLGTGTRPKDYLQIEYDKKKQTYTMRLDRIALVVRLRV